MKGQEMSYKKRALEMMQAIGAKDSGNQYDDGIWRVDFWLPKGIVWEGTGEHASWIREYTLTECWKSLIELAKDGVFNCEDTCDCRNWPTENIF